MLITTDGLVTRCFEATGNDRCIQLITPTRGRVTVTVKGGRTNRQGSAYCTQLFSYGNYELYGKGGHFWFRNGSPLHSFYALSADVNKMALAAYLCDVTSELTPDVSGAETPEGAEGNALLRMLLNALYTMNTGKKSDAIVKGVFEWRTASMMGYAPSLGKCDLCQATLPEHSYLDVMNGRLICADCQSKLNRMGGKIAEMRDSELGERRLLVPLSASVLTAIRYALGAQDKKIFSFTFTDKEEEYGFARAAETYLLNHLERGFDTLDFYHSVRI